MYSLNTKKRWIYKGSLTNPPCSGIVVHQVLSTVYPIKPRHLHSTEKDTHLRQYRGPTRCAHSSQTNTKNHTRMARGRGSPAMPFGLQTTSRTIHPLQPTTLAIHHRLPPTHSISHTKTRHPHPPTSRHPIRPPTTQRLRLWRLRLSHA